MEVKMDEKIINLKKELILLNLFVGQMGLSVDLTKENIYTLTEETEEYAESITDDITIYYVDCFPFRY